jgi:hypothetical protein
VYSGTFKTKQDALRGVLRTLVEMGHIFPFTLHLEYENETHVRQAKKFYDLYRRHVDKKLTPFDVKLIIDKYTKPKDKVLFTVFKHQPLSEPQEFKVKSYAEYVSDVEEDTEQPFFKSSSDSDSSKSRSLHYSGFVSFPDCTDDIMYSGTFKTEEDALRGILRTLVESSVLFPFTLHMEYNDKKHEQQANEFYALYRQYVNKNLTPFDLHVLFDKYTKPKDNIVFTVFEHEPFGEAEKFKLKSYEEYVDSMDEEEDEKQSFFKSISE